MPCLLPAAKDTAIAALPRKKLEAGSAESAGTSHPAILMLTAAPDASPAKGEPTLVHDEEKNTWGVVVPLSLAVEGESAAVTLNVQLVVVGVARRLNARGRRSRARGRGVAPSIPSATLTLTLAHPGRPGSPRDGLTDMSFSLLIALFLAFGFDTPTGPGAIPRAEVVPRVLEVLGGLAVVGLLAFGLGRLVAIRVAHRGRVTPAIRRFHALNRRIVMILTLAFYGWVIYQVGWPRVVRSGLGLGDTVLVDEALILLPFLLAQGLVLWGFFAAERALRPLEAAVQPIGLRRYLVLKARQSMGLVLPVAALFSLGQDLFRWQWPQAAEGPWAHPIGLAAMGAIVLVLSPAFIRLAWPTRPLPPGPLRDRLERVAARFGFRCTDILVWDTGGALINAGVTGALPWFRYVLLTDALIEDLEPQQVAAVFGHEIGHIAHRHLLYFGFFSLGSLGVMALAGGAIDASVGTWLGFLVPLGRLRRRSRSCRWSRS